ncbi:PmeII family type II restriction endonuclease [Anaerorhabdus sp.]|uniref:PmeII family type II restriction endonuclease n=1 Tax=Anaerorhabdus sp. TaxID=1872524 RepID=UPI002FC7863E
MFDNEALENEIGRLLDEFYRRRMEKINGLKLKDTLKRKNPYLYRSIGTEKASEIIEGLLSAYMSSSDEGIFGDAFFEPLAKFASQGVVSPSEGVDVALETETKYTAIAVKSGTNVFNAQSKKRQVAEFKSLESRLRKIQKQFDPLVGYCYGRKMRSSNTNFRELAGQAFWEEITGDEDFYLKIIRLMKEKPQEHAVEYKTSFAAAINRFTAEFIKDFCNEDGTINWEKLTEFNSGKIAPKTVKVKKEKK